MPSNRSRHAEWRDKVLLAFHRHGLHGVTVPPYAPASAAPRGDILGVPGWTIATRNQRAVDLADAMREVAREANAEGNDRYVSVQQRRGDEPDGAYAIMPLRIFLNVLTELHPEAVACAVSGYAYGRLVDRRT